MKSISFDFLAGDWPVHGLVYRFLEEYHTRRKPAFQRVIPSSCPYFHRSRRWRGGVGGVPPHLFPHQTPGMNPPEQGFIGEHHER